MATTTIIEVRAEGPVHLTHINWKLMVAMVAYEGWGHGGTTQRPSILAMSDDLDHRSKNVLALQRG